MREVGVHGCEVCFGSGGEGGMLGERVLRVLMEVALYGVRREP